MNRVTVENVAFAYDRERTALRDVSFELDPGIAGILGPNGAGKSTLLRLIAGIDRPSSGRILIHDKTPDDARRLGRIGFVPETSLFDDYLRVGEFLEGVATLADLPLPPVSQTLRDLYDRKLGTLSLGQRRRVEITAALIGRPPVLLLDEPTNGLDPFAVAELRETVLAQREAGTCVVISSHHLDEVQRVADLLVVLDAGQCLGSWTRTAALAQFGTLERLFHTVLQTRAIV